MNSVFAKRAWPVLALVLMQGCAFQKLGKELGDGLMQAVNDSSQSIGKNVVKGAGDGLREDVLNDATRGKLTDTVLQVEAAALSQLPAARDELLGPKTDEQMKRLIETLLDSMEARARSTSRGLMVDVGNGLRRDILNADTEARLNQLIMEVGNTTRGQTQQMRDDMLGEASQRQVKVLVDSAMGAVVDGTDKIRRQARDELSFIQKNTAETLLVVGGIAAIVMLVIWRQKEKNRLLLQLLAKQLQDMADAPAYTATLDRLQQQAELLGVKHQLEDALVLQGAIARRGKKKTPN